MARKDVLVSRIAAAQSLAASFTSPVTVIKYLDNIAYQINVTTTNSQGTFTVQGSLDYAVDGPSGTVTNAGNWIDLNLGSSPTVSAANTNIIINLNQLPFAAIRLVYTSAVAGTGACDILIAGKQLGG